MERGLASGSQGSDRLKHYREKNMKTKSILSVLVVFSSLVDLAADEQSDQAPQWKAGAAAISITPGSHSIILSRHIRARSLCSCSAAAAIRILIGVVRWNGRGSRYDVREYELENHIATPVVVGS